MGYAQRVGTGDEFAAVPQRDSGSHGLQVEAQGNNEDPHPDYILVSHVGVEANGDGWNPGNFCQPLPRLTPKNNVPGHPCEVIDDEVEAGRCEVSQDHAHKEGTGFPIESHSPVLENYNLDQPSQEHVEPESVYDPYWPDGITQRM